MNKPIVFLLIVLAVVGYVSVDARKEANKWKREAERYRELYLNCKINNDLHMKQHEGEFEPM